MSAAVQGSRDKMRPAKPKAVQDAPATPSVPMLAPATPSVPKQTPAALPMPVIHESPADHVKDDSGKDIPDSKNGPRYNEMIFEVLEEQSGMDIGSILAHIEKKSDVQVPQNFRKQLGARLRRLVAQDKLEKVDNHYRLKNNTLETNGSGQKGIWARQHPPTVYSKVSESVEEAAKTAAYKVAEAEYSTSLAAESVKDFEKLLKKAEETDTILQLAKEIFERCTHGEVLLVA